MNRRLFVLIALASLIILTSATSATAQGPTTGSNRAPSAALGTGFNYQGQLKKNGNLVTSTCNFQFGLWDAVSNGTQLGATQTVSSVSVANGLFNVTLNASNQFGANAFTGEARWLAISVQCMGDASYTAFTSRQPISPAPFALALPGLYTQQNATSPNIIGGFSGNNVTSGVYGATIGGGGAWFGFDNRVTDHFGTVSGGSQNLAGDNAGTIDDRSYATVGGGYSNAASGEAGTVGGGWANDAYATYATVSGGRQNWVSGYASTIGGGMNNTISAESATVSGGYANTANSHFSTIGGGQSNTTGGQHATVGGGYSNDASIASATIAGGWDNTASSNAATVGGGASNLASGPYSTVGGGGRNTASGGNATVAGGDWNTAAGNLSFAAGYRAKANHASTFVWGDSTNADFASTADNQFLIRATAVGIGTNNPGSNKLAVAGNGYFDFGGSRSVNVGTPGGWPGVIAMVPNGNRRDIYFTDSGMHLSVSNTFGSGGMARGIFIDQNTANVGIGTTGPSAKLDVAGTTATNILQIRGGADLAEKFDVSGDQAVEPGTLMVIDENNPGRLKLSELAYDTKVAGIVSGAGGVQPGLTLHQQDVMDGSTVVTIAGRVYVKAESLSSPIKPGDLLTTSTMPGYAMKAIDRERAQGAIIGKAMSGLETGTGLVLVLVNLQ
ncbi:MAG: hypothetical protein HZB51_05885 [Chloroflexi bacterium]|nr:hypothetical protein [Chloroflexota bacterium]